MSHRNAVFRCWPTFNLQSASASNQCYQLNGLDWFRDVHMQSRGNGHHPIFNANLLRNPMQFDQMPIERPSPRLARSAAARAHAQLGADRRASIPPSFRSGNVRSVRRNMTSFSGRIIKRTMLWPPSARAFPRQISFDLEDRNPSFAACRPCRSLLAPHYR